MRAVRTILVAIKDPGSPSRALLSRAAQIARAFGARLELFHAITTPVYADSFGVDGSGLRRLRQDYRAARLEQLEKLAARLRRRSIDVSVGAEWDFPAAEALVRRATEIKADLIIAASHPGRHTMAWLLGFSDWELLRLSPVPVLLVKSSRSYGRRPALLAAVDPTHAYAKPARLDEEILSAAESFRKAFGGRLHAMHSYLPLPLPPLNGAAVPASIEAEAARGASVDFERVLRNTRIPRENRHLVPAHPEDAIPAMARRTRSALVIMGAISRSGLKRLFIGNTAERVLDALPCDVLVVKPPHFERRVQRARQAAAPTAAAAVRRA